VPYRWSSDAYKSVLPEAKRVKFGLMDHIPCDRPAQFNSARGVSYLFGGLRYLGSAGITEMSVRGQRETGKSDPVSVRGPPLLGRKRVAPGCAHARLISASALMPSAPFRNSL